MLSRTQLFITEIGEGCNLSRVHPKCPSSNPHRFANQSPCARYLDDDTIVECVSAAYNRFGFRGLWGVHYYCEPTIYATRLIYLTKRIRERVQSLKTILWTNGTLQADLIEAGEFEQIYHSSYTPSTIAIKARYKNLHVLSGKLDDRLEVRLRSGDSPCLRIWTEFILDARGQHHPCCYDWRGEASLGNIFEPGGFEALVRRWEACQKAVGGDRMTEDSPESCRTCGYRTCSMTRFFEESVKNAIDWRAENERTLKQC